MFQKYWNRKLTGLLLMLFALIFLCGFVFVLTHNEIDLGYNQGYAPSQPIAFSHELHAGKYKMDCRYCHTAVEESRHASIPSLNICMNCHLNIKKQSPALALLRKAYEEKKAVQWKKVHLLPDFVKFNHAPHIKALTGENSNSDIYRQSCRSCHGSVSTMDLVLQKETLSMGWCIQCHRKEENKDWLIQCSTCHY